MNGEQFHDALRRGRRAYGTIIVSSSPHSIPTVRTLGLDFVFLDTEHAPANRERLSWTCRLYAAMGVAPMVRIPKPDPCEAAKVLDGGAAAVLAPYVESPEQVRELAGAVRFAPLKGERLAAHLAGEPLEEQLETYLAERNKARSLLVNIESTPAIERLDDLCAVPGLDGVIIGPNDLSCSLGVPEQYHHPRFVEAVDRIIRTARAHHVAAGIHLIYEDRAIEDQVRWAGLGANILLHQGDTIAAGVKLTGDFAALRNALDPGAAPADASPADAV